MFRKPCLVAKKLACVLKKVATLAKYQNLIFIIALKILLCVNIGELLFWKRIKDLKILP